MATEMGLILTVVVAVAIVVALIALISISIKVTRILGPVCLQTGPYFVIIGGLHIA